MTTEAMQKLASEAMSAVSTFTKLYDGASAMFGRGASGYVIDCLKTDQRLVLATIEQCPGVVCLGLGRKNSVDEPKILGQFPIERLTSADLLEVMQQHFAT